jgi:hypothetical protein
VKKVTQDASIGIGGESHLSSPPLSSPPTPLDKRVRIRRFDELTPCRTAQSPEVQRTHSRWWFRRSSSSIAGFTRSQLAQDQPESRLAGAWPRMRRAFLLSLLIVQAFVPPGTTMPAADFCRTVRVDRSTLGSDSETCGRPIGVSSTAVNAQLENLQPALLKDVDFAVTGQLVRRRRPHIRFLTIGSRHCSTPPSDPTSR